MPRRSRSPLTGRGVVPARAAAVAASVSDVDALSAEQPCVNRPRAWSEQRQRSAERARQQVDTQARCMREPVPSGHKKSKYTGRGRPQANQEKDPSCHRYRAEGHRNERSGRDERVGDRQDQTRRRSDAHEHKPGPGCTIGKRGIEPLHPCNLRTLARSGNPRTGLSANSFEPSAPTIPLTTR